MKNILFVLAIILSFDTFAQKDCKLINKAILSVDTSSKNKQVITVLRLRDSVNTTSNEIRAQIDINKWHYFAITKEANLTGKIYIDGQLIEEGKFQNNNYLFNQLHIGARYYTSWDGFFKGWLDEFRMSNKIRTSSEILNYYQSKQPFTADSNTIGLWHFDESSGTSFANSVAGSGTLYNGASFTTGKFSNAVYFDGTNDRGNCNLDIPENNITFEFWAKLDGSQDAVSVVSAYGLNNVHFTFKYVKERPSFTWSTRQGIISRGDTTGNVTINPQIDTIVWVTDGNCTDTMIFNSTKVYDTVTTYTSVQDTLIIDATLTGVAAPNNTNQLKVYPNPAKTHITVDNGNYSSMNGYTITIENSLGQTVFSSAVNQQSFYIDLTTWSGNGLYFLHLIDNTNNTIEIKKIMIE